MRTLAIVVVLLGILSLLLIRATYILFETWAEHEAIAKKNKLAKGGMDA